MTPADPDGPLRDRLLAAVQAEFLAGSPVAGRDDAHQRAVVNVAVSRWRSFARRSSRPDRASHADRVEDLAKGLRDRFETEPALTGPLMADYRALATVLATVLALHP